MRAFHNFIKIYSPALIPHSPPFLFALNYLAQQIKEVGVSNLIMNISLRIKDTTKEKSFTTADTWTPVLDYLTEVFCGREKKDDVEYFYLWSCQSCKLQCWTDEGKKPGRWEYLYYLITNSTPLTSFPRIAVVISNIISLYMCYNILHFVYGILLPSIFLLLN